MPMASSLQDILDQLYNYGTGQQNSQTLTNAQYGNPAGRYDPNNVYAQANNGNYWAQQYLTGGGGSSGGASGGKSLADQLAQKEFDAQQKQNALDNQFRQQQLSQQYGIAMGDQQLQRLLGQQNYDVGLQRIALDKTLGQQNNAINAAQQYASRAGRQLVAPGGRVAPSFQPILGRMNL